MPNVSKITHDGQTRSLKEWSLLTKIPPATIKSRLLAGKSIAEALTTPIEKRFARAGRRKKDAERTCPELRHREESGLAYCRWFADGKDNWQYFGPWGSDEARRRYKRFQIEWATGAVATSSTEGETTISRLVLRWIEHCERTYVKRGRPTSEVHCNRSAMRDMNELYGDEPAASFSVPKLRVVREAMVGNGWTRDTINDNMARIIRAFGWAAGEQLVALKVRDELKLLEPLAAGRRKDVPENEKVDTVPQEHLEAVLNSKALHPTPKRRALLATMIRVQLWAGMRPGELLGLRPVDIDRTVIPWRHEAVEYNKMLHKNLSRPIFFGPLARDALAPLLAECPPDVCLFRFPPWRKKADWSPVTIKIYRGRIADACKAEGIPVWTPNQLRHNKATDVMDAYESDEATAAVLGNTPEVARQVYARRAGETVARRIAEETG